MAIGKIAVCLILSGAAWTQQFPVRHQHLRKFCAGTLTVEASGIRFNGPKGHTWELAVCGDPTVNTAPGKYSYTVL